MLHLDFQKAFSKVPHKKHGTLDKISSMGKHRLRVDYHTEQIEFFSNWKHMECYGSGLIPQLVTFHMIWKEVEFTVSTFIDEVKVDWGACYNETIDILKQNIDRLSEWAKVFTNGI